MNLTPRERDIIEALLRGATNREIAKQLGIGENYVKRKLSDIFLKFGIDQGSRRVKLVVKLLEERQGREQQLLH